MKAPELWQFQFSMFPEKARWALDFKKVPHIRHSLLPGPHVPQLLLRFGQKSMPIFRHERNLIKSSPEVIDYIERTWPYPPLYPEDQEQYREALELQKWFDEAGPHVRRAGFYEWLPHTEYTGSRFATGASESTQKLYVQVFPITRAIMKLDMRITASGAQSGRLRTREALDFVAEKSSQTGYLVGDSFTVADLAAATILQPTCLPPEYPAAVPEPRPEGWLNWLKRWENHEGCDYVRRMYKEHRGVSSEIQVSTG